MNRHYMTEMRAILDQETPDGPYRIADLATRIVIRLRAEDPELLHGWLQQQAVEFVGQMIRSRDASVRARTRAISGRTNVRKIIDSGKREALTDWLSTVYTVNEQNLRKRLGVMSRAEVEYAASQYEYREHESRLMKLFMRAIGKRMADEGVEAVEELYSEDQLRAMWNSLNR